LQYQLAVLARHYNVPVQTGLQLKPPLRETTDPRCFLSALASTYDVNFTRTRFLRYGGACSGSGRQPSGQN
jgi:hypothetical protein